MEHTGSTGQLLHKLAEALSAADDVDDTLAGALISDVIAVLDRRLAAANDRTRSPQSLKRAQAKASDHLIRDLQTTGLSLERAYREELCDRVDRHLINKIYKELSCLEGDIKRFKLRVGLNIRVDRI